MRIRLATIGALLLALTGCSLLGPSPADIEKAYDAVIRGLRESASYNQQIRSEYSNSADISTASPDGSTRTTAKILMDSEHALFMNGKTTFSRFRDASSGYTIDGAATFKIDNIRKDNPDAMSGRLAVNVTLEGGPVKSMDVTITRESGKSTVDELLVNGKKINLEDWSKLEEMLKAIAPSTAG